MTAKILPFKKQKVKKEPVAVITTCSTCEHGRSRMLLTGRPFCVIRNEVVPKDFVCSDWTRIDYNEPT